MELFDVQKYVSDQKAVLSAKVSVPGKEQPQEVFFAFPEKYYDYMPMTADPFFPAILIPAMLAGEQLDIKAPLSAKMRKNQGTIQSVFASWFPEDFKHIKITAGSYIEDGPPRLKPNATFFSLGVDSMYSMLKHTPPHTLAAEKRVSALIYMKGLELPLSIYSKGQDHHVIADIHKVALHYDLDLIVGETNIRDVFPLVWEQYYSGPGLAATALSLSSGFSTVYIPSSHSYANLSPNPSSPLVDYLWSNEEVSIVHDGAETERARKIANVIAQDAFALNNLRVCVNNEGGSYNCGKCWKCIRTMVTLKIINRLEDASSFPHNFPAHFNRELRTYKTGSMKFTMENLKLAHDYGDKEMARILLREIRIGKLDLFREGKSFRHLISEMMYYTMVKAGRRLKLFS